MLTTQAIVERSLAAYSTRVAVVHPGGELTYRQLDERSARLANALLAAGCGAQRPAAVFLGNDHRFVEVDVACMRAGITRVGVSSRLSADECQFIVNHSDSAALVTNATLLEKLDRGAIRGLKTILVIDAARDRGDGLEDYEAALARAQATLICAPVGADHSAFIMYTSGTTGRPKGAAHSHGSRAAALNNMLASEILVSPRPTMIHGAAITHGSGSKILAFMALGGRNVILPRFDPSEFARTAAANPGSNTFLAPTMIQMLLDGGEKVREQIRQMGQISFGGSPISASLFGRALEAFGPILTQVYGSCEAPHPITVLRPDDYCNEPDPTLLAETAGRASHASECAVLDHTGRALGVNAEGELVVRGFHLMSGYWRDPAATAEVINAGGWYGTGDVATVDEQGFVRLIDRKRDLIITGGLNVYPSEVERVLEDHPAISEVAVVSYPDDRWGECVLACVVIRCARAASEADIINWMDGRIAAYKKPKKILFMDALPKGSTNKILRRELKAQFWSGASRKVN